MKHAVIVVGLTALLGGCASNSGVVSIGSDTFVVSRQAATGFTGMGTLRTEALKEAADTCVAQGKRLVVLNEKEAQPPYVFGNFPRIDVTFTCKAPDVGI
jgi:hypothetical protein